MTETLRSGAWDIDQPHFDALAANAAQCLADHGFTHLLFTPGDATRYEFIITAPDPEGDYGSRVREYTVVLSGGLGDAYAWAGDAVHESYALTKWARRHEWTSVIVSRFLTTLAPLLPGRGE